MPWSPTIHISSRGLHWLIKAVPLLLLYDSQIPSTPHQNHTTSSPCESSCNSSENVPKSCHGARFSLATLCFWDDLKMSLLTMKIRKVQERNTALWGADAQAEQSHWYTNLVHSMWLFSYMQTCHTASQMWNAPLASAVQRIWSPATCQRLWRSHMMEMWQMMTISSFLSAA